MFWKYDPFEISHHDTLTILINGMSGRRNDIWVQVLNKNGEKAPLKQEGSANRVIFLEKFQRNQILSYHQSKQTT